LTAFYRAAPDPASACHKHEGLVNAQTRSAVMVVGAFGECRGCQRSVVV